MKRLLASAILILSLSACASVLESATQDVTVLTPGANDSICFLHNGQVLYRVWPPDTIRVSKRPGDLEVRCLAEGNREKLMVIEPRHQEVVLANAFNGFVPGMFVDYHTGAMFAYPQVISVDFTDVPAQSMPRPNYDLYLMENPDLFGMEEFRPGDAALMRDMYEEPIALEKREIPGSEGIDMIVGGDIIEGEAPTPQEPLPPGDLTSELTRQMNPQVFGPPAKGFVGGTADGGVATTGPVTIYPVE